MTLAIAAQKGNREAGPPQRRDDKRQARGNRRGNADSGTAEDERQTADERHRGAHVTPGIPMGGDCVHAPVTRDVDKHGIVKRHRRVEAHRGQHVDDQERKPTQGQRHAGAADDACEKEAEEELDFLTLEIGQGTQDGHKDCHNQACNRLGIPERRDNIGAPGTLKQGIEVDGRHGGAQQHERRVSHVVKHPFAFNTGKLCGHGKVLSQGGETGRCALPTCRGCPRHTCTYRCAPWYSFFTAHEPTEGKVCALEPALYTQGHMKGACHAGTHHPPSLRRGSSAPRRP